MGEGRSVDTWDIADLTNQKMSSLKCVSWCLQTGDVDECGVCGGSGNTCVLALTLQSDTLSPAASAANTSLVRPRSVPIFALADIAITTSPHYPQNGTAVCLPAKLPSSLIPSIHVVRICT